MKIDVSGSKIDFPASWDRFFASRGPKQGSKPDFLIRSGPWGGQGVPEGGLIDIRGQPEKKQVPRFDNNSLLLISLVLNQPLVLDSELG